MPRGCCAAPPTTYAFRPPMPALSSMSQRSEVEVWQWGRSGEGMVPGEELGVLPRAGQVVLSFQYLPAKACEWWRLGAPSESKEGHGFPQSLMGTPFPPMGLQLCPQVSLKSLFSAQLRTPRPLFRKYPPYITLTVDHSAPLIPSPQLLAMSGDFWLSLIGRG